MDRLSIATDVIACLVLATSLCRGGAESISCDSVLFAELGKPYIIACNVTGDQYFVYWFKGGDTSTLPILSFDDQGEKSLHKEYSFTDNKSLNITNTELKHEGKYTLRVYFNQFDFDTAKTELQVYVRPGPPCPLIDACGSTCTGCQLNVTTSGSLTCYVNGSRPMVDVDWIVTNQSGVSFTKEEQTHKEMGDRWYTEKTIEYTTPDCGADATFRCIAPVSDFPFASLLDTYSSAVRINTGACKEPPSSEPTSSPKGQVVWPFVFIGIVIVLVMLILIACYLCRSRGTSIQIATPDYVEMQQPPKQKKKSLEERKNTLVEGLMKYYEKFCFIKPLPWGEPIPIHALYTTCQCTVTNANGVVSQQDSGFLSTPEFNFDCKNRVFIIADLGYGKTTYTQHLVSDWVSKMKTPKVGKKDKISEPILIYVHLKEVDPSMILSEIVQKMMPVGIDLIVADIVEIFLTFEFQVLLDGLDELSMSTISTDTSPENPTNDKEESVNLLQEEGQNDANLTVGNLLNYKINIDKFKKIKVWVTSREVDDMQASFALPYSKVKLNGFSNSQVNEYVHKTCKYYFESQAIPQLPLIPEPNMKGYKLDATQQAKSDANNQEMIESKSTNSESRPVTEGGCSNSENVKYENPVNSEKNEKNINEVTKNKIKKGNKKNTENKEHDTVEESQTVDMEQLQNEEMKEKTIDSNKGFTEDANNEANESNIISDDVSDEVTTKLIPAAHHEIKQEESEQKGNTLPRNDGQTPEASDTLQILSEKVSECMEINEIFQNFADTPLLLIMIIHIITSRMLDPTGKYKEVNVNKLTTIIRLVITCLESRYVQKVNNQSTEEDIKKLEASLGKIAFENKMSLSLGKREYWNNKLGEKDTQLALAVGLLKYSKKVGSGGSQLEELAFSSYAGIMFYHEFFQEFLAAQYVPEEDKEWAWIDEFITKSTDEATVRLLQFMFGMNHARLDKAVKSLMNEQKMWNNLIDCIYEISNLDRKRTVIKDMSKVAGRMAVNMNINIQHLDRKHHKVALTDFCDACYASAVKLRGMAFREECAIDFIEKVTLPSLKILSFLDMNINEDHFVSIITSLTNRKCPEILQFVKCSVPVELKDAKQTVELALKGLDMKIYNCETKSPFTMSVPKFNPKKGKWENEYFPEDK